MTTGPLLAAALLVFSPGIAEKTEAAPRVFAVLAEFDRMAALPLWPGFSPQAVPLEVFDGGQTWLVRHPQPPAEFVEVPGHPSVRVFAGRHASVRANTAVELAGARTATASLEGKTASPRFLAALLLHEAFHVFEKARHPKWAANEADLFVYPVDDAEALALRRLESRALARALDASALDVASAWAARAVELRRRRFEALPASASAYERGTEWNEGLARYIEAASAGLAAPLFSDQEFAAAAVRERAYASGCGMALLLDRLDPDWKRGLEEKDVFLDDLLGRAVAKAAPSDVAPREREAAAIRARSDVAAWTESRARLRREFLESPGWTVVVEARAPLFPQAFDPLNIERLSASEVLHTRWIKLGNAEGSLEALESRCLTESAGKHPLFTGVRRATVAGLSEEPRVGESEGGVTVAGTGVTMSFRPARVSRSGRTITITVPD